MLRITEVPGSPSGIALKVEGQIVSEWVGELERECRRALTLHTSVQLDFEEVTHIDRRGAEMLEGLQGMNLSIVKCPPLIRTVLHGEGTE